jgi:hypothetical protein
VPNPVIPLVYHPFSGSVQQLGLDILHDIVASSYYMI